MYENKPDNDDYVEYYVVRQEKSNNYLCCCQCGLIFEPTKCCNVYELKKQYFSLFFCEPCLIELKKRSILRDKIELFWFSLQFPELQ